MNPAEVTLNVYQSSTNAFTFTFVDGDGDAIDLSIYNKIDAVLMLGARQNIIETFSTTVSSNQVTKSFTPSDISQYFLGGNYRFEIRFYTDASNFDVPLIVQVNLIDAFRPDADLQETTVSISDTEVTATIPDSATYAALALQAKDDAETWAEGTDAEVVDLGGEKSSKGWAEVAEGYATTLDRAEIQAGDAGKIERIKSDESGWEIVDSTVTTAKAIDDSTSKATPVDADTLGLVDSAASNVLKKLTWANLKSTLKDYFDSVAQTLTNKTMGDELDAGSNKIINVATPTEDNDASNKIYVDDKASLSATFVDDFGAVGDGATDDTSAIQSALDSLTTGGVLRFTPNKTYIISPVITGTHRYALNVPYDNITIVIPESTTIKLSNGALASGENCKFFIIGTDDLPRTNVNIGGHGTLDGNISNQTVASTGGIQRGVIHIGGASSHINVDDLTIKDSVNTAVMVKGKASTDDRASFIKVKNITANNCAEGVEWIHCDWFWLEDSEITNMWDQDCVEPAGFCNHWWVTGCKIDNASDDNSEIEVFPGNGGDNENGKFLFNTVTNGVFRISVGSGTASGDGTVKNLIIAHNTFDGSEVFNAGTGKSDTIKIENNIFEGPIGATDLTHAVTNFIRFNDDGTYTKNVSIVNNEFEDCRGAAILCNPAYSKVNDNRVTDPSSDNSLSAAEKSGIRLGDNCEAHANIIRDTKVTPLMEFGYTIGDSCHISGGEIEGAQTIGVNLTGVSSYRIQDVKGFVTKRTQSLTISSVSTQQLSNANLDSGLHSDTSFQVTPKGNIGGSVFWAEQANSSSYYVKRDATGSVAVDFWVTIDSSERGMV